MNRSIATSHDAFKKNPKDCVGGFNGFMTRSIPLGMDPGSVHLCVSHDGSRTSPPATTTECDLWTDVFGAVASAADGSATLGLEPFF